MFLIKAGLSQSLLCHLGLRSLKQFIWCRILFLFCCQIFFKVQTFVSIKAKWKWWRRDDGI